MNNQTLSDCGVVARGATIAGGSSSSSASRDRSASSSSSTGGGSSPPGSSSQSTTPPAGGQSASSTTPVHPSGSQSQSGGTLQSEIPGSTATSRVRSEGRPPPHGISTRVHTHSQGPGMCQLEVLCLTRGIDTDSKMYRTNYSDYFRWRTGYINSGGIFYCVGWSG
jgi:hypothetical protein